MFKDTAKVVIFFLLTNFIINFPAVAGYENYLNRAVKQHKKHKYDAAIINYTKAIDIAENHSIQAQTGQYSNEYEEYPLEYSLEYSVEDNLSDLYFNRGLAESEAGYSKEALEDFSKSINLNPYNDSAFFNRAIVKYELRMYKSALHDFDRTLSLVPGDAKALFNRAMTKYQLKDIRGALSDAKKSKKYFKQLRKRNEVQEVNEFIESIKMERSFFN
ncbi:MAG: hypothetical protein QNJ31_02155 [Candidatus Caenarcaniphilales bacterium]|nr:hypothetical protein [Candidatus Caenarcaniphilales bacterium]